MLHNSRITVKGQAAQTVAATPERLTRASHVEGYTVCSTDINETVANTKALLQPQQRFSDSDMASAGFKNLLFNGATVNTIAQQEEESLAA